MRTHFAHFIALLLILIFNRSNSFTQSFPLTTTSTHYAPKDYNGYSQVWQVVQDNTGRLYFANSFTGLLIYDGARWQKLALPDEKRLFSIDGMLAPTGNISPFNALFAGSMGDVGVFHGNINGCLSYKSLLKNFDSTKTKDLNNGFITWDTQNINSEVIFNVQDYLLNLTMDSTNVLYDTNQYFTPFVVEKELWVKRIKSSFISVNTENNSIKELPYTSFFSDKPVYGLTTFKKTGQYIFVTRNDGLYLCDSAWMQNGGSDPIRLYGASPSVHITQNGNSEFITESPILSELTASQPYGSAGGYYGDQEVAWINTAQKGIFAVDETGKVLKHINILDGLRDNMVLDALYSGSPGRDMLWACTNNGISMFDLSDPVKKIGIFSLPEGGIVSLVRHKGALVAATNMGVYVLEQKKEGVFTKVKGLDDQCWGLLTVGRSKGGKKDSVVAVSGGNSGTWILDRKNEMGRWTLNRIDDHFSYGLCSVKSSGTKEMLCSSGREGFNLFGTEEGNLLYNTKDLPGKVHAISQSDALGNLPIVNPTDKDSLYFWLGTYQKGLIRLIVSGDLSGHRTELWDTTHGIASGENNVFSYQGRVIFGTKKGLWCQSADPKGKIVLKPFKGISETFAGGESNMQIFKLVQGGNGRAYVNLGDSQILSYIPQDSNSSTIDSISFLSFDIGQINNIYPDPTEKGIVWFGGYDGILRYDEKAKKDYKVQWPAMVTGLWLGEDSLLFGGYFSEPWPEHRYVERKIIDYQPEEMVPHIAYGSGKLRFQYACPIYSYKEKVRYRYMLQGFDKGWSSWTKDIETGYTNLPASEYVFRVQAKNVYGSLSKEGVFRLVIEPPWYQRAEAYFLYVLALSVAVGLAVKFQTRRLVAQKKELEKKIEEKTVEVVKERDEAERQKVKVEEAHEQLEEQHKEIQDSIKYAKRIQEAIMPSMTTMNESLINGFVLYEPKDVVAGDFFWLEQMDQVVYYAVADCTGHGVPGAMVSVVCSNALTKSLLEERILDTGQLLDRTREIVIERLAKSGEDVKDGMDISLCALNMKTKELKWSGANNPLWILRKGAEDFEETKADKQPIGKYHEPKPFTQHSICLNEGDTIYTFTDGYQDQFGGPKGKKFKAKQLRQILLDHQHLKLDEQHVLLVNKFKEWQGPQEQVDDVCMIGVRV